MPKNKLDLQSTQFDHLAPWNVQLFQRVLEFTGYPVHAPVVYLWAVAEVQGLEEDEVAHGVKPLVDNVGAGGVDGLDIPARLPWRRESLFWLEHPLQADKLSSGPVFEFDPTVSAEEECGCGKVRTESQQPILDEPLAPHQLLIFWKCWKSLLHVEDFERLVNVFSGLKKTRHGWIKMLPLILILGK